jgi:hypothetical protein
MIRVALETTGASGVKRGERFGLALCILLARLSPVKMNVFAMFLQRTAEICDSASRRGLRRIKHLQADSLHNNRDKGRLGVSALIGR